MPRITTQHRLSRFLVRPLAVLMLLMTLVITAHSPARQTSQDTSPLAATFEAHGGLNLFRTFGTMAYTMKGFPLSAPMSKTNRSTVDLKTRKNRIDGDGSPSPGTASGRGQRPDRMRWDYPRGS